VEGAQPAFTLVLALAVGVLAQSVARHLRLPGIVLLLVAGAGLGPDGLGWVQPEQLGEGLLTLVELSVAIILFEGGLNLEISRLRREQAPIRRLVLGGALVTLLGGGLAARLLLDWDWMGALVFGSLVVVTGPTVVGPLVRELRLRPRVATVLEGEGVLIDPVGAILAVLLIEVALAPGADSLASGATVLLYRVGVGALAGAAGGFALAWLLRARRLIPEGHENIMVLAAVLLLFQGCNEVLSQSGLLAVTIAGVVVGNLRSSVDRDLREFKDQLTVLLIGLLFVLLAAAVRFDDVRALGAGGLAVVVALVFVVRPLGVWLATASSELSVRERLLIAWMAPRGIVAAAVASATAVALERAGVSGGRELLALVFLTIACTVLLAGLTAGPVASLLGQRLPGREGVAILGAQGLGLLLASELRDAGVAVVFFDSNPQSCRRAEEKRFTVVYGDALQERTLQRARMETIGVVVGLTSNQMLNSIFVSRARERFRVPSGYVAVERPEAGLAPELVREEVAHVLFDGPHDVERWDVRARHGGVAIERWAWRGAEESEEEAGEAESARANAGNDTFVILTLRRGSRTVPMHAGFDLKADDVAAVAVYREEREAAHESLRTLGWVPHQEQEAAA
jgi:NhaP-type Na+/H+ or K+/H+ antiporter